MTKKRCPFCDHQTTTTALKCAHCGAQLQEVLLVTDPLFKAPSKRFSLASAAKVFLYCVVVVCGAICGVAAMLPAPPSSYSSIKVPQMQNWAGYRTTATDLYHNYPAYEASAKLSSGNAAIEISGTIKSTAKNLFDEIEVNLTAGSDAQWVTITLDHAGAETQPLLAGAKVSVRCENMARILGPPTGQGCQVVQ